LEKEVKVNGGFVNENRKRKHYDVFPN